MPNETLKNLNVAELSPEEQEALMRQLEAEHTRVKPRESATETQQNFDLGPDSKMADQLAENIGNSKLPADFLPPSMETPPEVQQLLDQLEHSKDRKATLSSWISGVASGQLEPEAVTEAQKKFYEAHLSD